MALLSAFDGIGLSLQPLVRVLHISHVRICGAMVSVLVIRVERLNLLIVRETPRTKALLQQCGLRLRRRKRDTLRHLTDYHHNSPYQSPIVDALYPKPTLLIAPILSTQ